MAPSRLYGTPAASLAPRHNPADLITMDGCWTNARLAMRRFRSSETRVASTAPSAAPNWRGVRDVGRSVMLSPARASSVVTHWSDAAQTSFTAQTVALTNIDCDYAARHFGATTATASYRSTAVASALTPANEPLVDARPTGLVLPISRHSLSSTPSALSAGRRTGARKALSLTTTTRRALCAASSAVTATWAWVASATILPSFAPPWSTSRPSSVAV